MNPSFTSTNQQNPSICNCGKRINETWSNDPIWGGWSSYQGCDFSKEGTVKIPESEYKEFVAWKLFLESRKRYLDLLRLDLEQQRNNTQFQRPTNHYYPPGWTQYGMQFYERYYILPKPPLQPDIQRYHRW